jgi:hypothetical protein
MAIRSPSLGRANERLFNPQLDGNVERPQTSTTRNPFHSTISRQPVTAASGSPGFADDCLRSSSLFLNRQPDQHRAGHRATLGTSCFVKLGANQKSALKPPPMYPGRIVTPICIN